MQSIRIERIAAPGFILELVNLTGLHSSHERTAQIKSDLQSVEDILQPTGIFENLEEQHNSCHLKKFSPEGQPVFNKRHSSDQGDSR